jgi:hypothetical protein
LGGWERKSSDKSMRDKCMRTWRVYVHRKLA